MSLPGQVIGIGLKRAQIPRRAICPSRSFRGFERGTATEFRNGKIGHSVAQQHKVFYDQTRHVFETRKDDIIGIGLSQGIPL